MQAHLITAPGDGVGPAVLLSLPGAGAASGRASGSSTQYLFNVPEGFARLVLEHKIRPGSGLRAAFACDAAALSGFGGLVMRLRGEGHEQLHVVGPAGCQAAVSSLRHFINWKHPAVLLEEASPWERSSVVFQDDRIAVAAIWKPPLLDASWNAPQWMVHAQLPATAAKEGGSTSSASSSSGCSSESSGSERASGASESDSSSDDSSSSEVSDAGDSSGSDSSAESSDEEAGQQAGQRPAAALPGVAPGGGSAARGAEGVFDALDELLMSGRGGRRLALAHLKAATASQAEAPGSVPRGSGGTGQSSGTAAGGAGAAAAPAARAEQTAERAALAAATAARSAVANGAPSRRRQGAAGGAAAAAGGAEASDVVVLGGKRYQRLPEKAGINLWVCHKLTSLAAGSPAVGEAVGRGTPAGRGNASLGPPPQQEQQQQQQVLGFLCHLKATDQLLLLTNVHSKAAATQLAQHPALALLLQQPERAAGVLHLAAPGVAGSAALRQLCQQLRPLAAAAGGQQLLLEQPGPHGSSQVIGHVAAARTTAKLNLISSRIFPLPAGVRPPSGAPRQGAPPAFATADGTAPAAANGSPAACSSGDIVVEQVQLDCEHQSEGEDGQEDKQRHQQRQAEQQQQQQQQQQREPRDRSVSAGSKRPSCGDERTSGILIVRNVSVASWEAMGSPVVDQQAGQGPDGAGQNCEPAVPGAAVAVPARPGGSAGAPLGEQAQLVVEPVESFAAATLACGGRFDAAAVQAEVQQERPQLLVQLELLQGQQEQGMLPGPEQLAAAANQTAAQRWCAQNRVAPPPPPPLPSPAAVAPFEQLANQQRSVQQLGAPAHQQFANVPLLWQQPAVVHQQYWHAQHQPPAWHPQWLLPAGTPSPLPGAAMMLPHPAPQQWHGAQPVMAAAPFVATAALQGAPPRHQPAPPPPARAPPGPPPAEPEQQAAAAEPAASNKRAADGLRARLQGGKRSRQQQASSDAPAAAAQRPEGAEQQEQQQAGKQPDLAERHGGRDQRLPAWLENVPAGLLQLGAGASGRAGPEVLFLGTGSAEPSKYRGASAIQLRLSCGQSILMDCGEGTLGALCRAHGTAAAQRHVASLGCVWVSHRHADHMSGVLPLLAAYPASLPPLLLVGPRSLRDWLAEAAPPLGLAGRYRFVHCLELNQPGHWARHALQRHLGISHLHCVPVRHCSDAYGLVLRHEEGWSMVYSGDTQPSQQLVQAGAGCTLLIHEATFEPCLEQQARQKRHSTTAEALDVAQRMGAYRCILTHFSQRYPKWPEGVGQAPRAEGNAPTDSVSPTQIAPAMAAVAFDGMRVPLELLPVLPALMPAVQAALAAVEEEEELEEGEKPDGAA